jgi:hypothetical protein
MLKRLGSKDVVDFAIELAQEFSKRCPPDMGVKSAIGLARAIDEICNLAAEFQRDRRLGLYGKARFGTEFKLRLKENGYAPQFVDELTTKLLINMSGK